MNASDPSEYAIAVRVLVALVFAIGAVGKLRHLQTFEGVVANYRVLPEFLIKLVAVALPLVELCVGAGLLAGFSAWPAAAAGVLQLVFAIAMAVNLLRGRKHIDCGCFDSTLKQTLRWSLVARNGLLMVMLIATLPIVSTAAGDTSRWARVEGGLAGAAACIILLSCNALWAIPTTTRRTLARGTLARRTLTRRTHRHAEETS